MKVPFARVLIVDDEPRSQMRIQFALESVGFQCDLAADGPEALQRIAEGMADPPAQVAGQDRPLPTVLPTAHTPELPEQSLPVFSAGAWGPSFPARVKRTRQFPTPVRAWILVMLVAAPIVAWLLPSTRLLRMLP